MLRLDNAHGLKLLPIVPLCSTHSFWCVSEFQTCLHIRLVKVDLSSCAKLAFLFFSGNAVPTCSGNANLLPQHVVLLRFHGHLEHPEPRGSEISISLVVEGLEVLANHPTDQYISSTLVEVELAVALIVMALVCWG